jgi:hypothetical protein
MVRWPTPLDGFYPDAARAQAGFYLAGENVAGTSPSPSVLWFTLSGSGTFRQYNWSPFVTCHWDQLQWTAGLLRYQSTHDQCGTAEDEIDYSPGVAFLPQSWTPGVPWAVSGSSAAIYIDHDRVVCQGINRWTSDEVSAGQVDVFQDMQTIAWTSGADPSGCAAGSVTRWYENFTIAALPVDGSAGTAGALVREVGGDIDRFVATGQWDYDVRFSAWKQLPLPSAT